MKDLLANAQAYANKIFGAMRGQKAAFEDLNNAKMDASAFYSNTVALENPPPAPDLPDSGDLAPAASFLSLNYPEITPLAPPDSDDDDPVALLALSAERVRQSARVAVSIPTGLKPWGQVEAHTVA